MQMDVQTLLSLVLVFAAVHVGLVALNGTDLVQLATMGNADLERYAKLAVGLVGALALYQLVAKLL